MPALNWAQWVLIAVFAIEGIYFIAAVGQPRKPVSAGAAVINVLFNSACIWLIVLAGR